MAGDRVDDRRREQQHPGRDHQVATAPEQPQVVLGAFGTGAGPVVEHDAQPLGVEVLLEVRRALFELLSQLVLVQRHHLQERDLQVFAHLQPARRFVEQFEHREGAERHARRDRSRRVGGHRLPGGEPGVEQVRHARQLLEVAERPVDALVGEALLRQLAGRNQRHHQLGEPRRRVPVRHVHRQFTHAARHQGHERSRLARPDDQHVQVHLIGDDLVEDLVDRTEVPLDVGRDRLEVRFAGRRRERLLRIPVAQHPLGIAPDRLAHARARSRSRSCPQAACASGPAESRMVARMPAVLTRRTIATMRSRDGAANGSPSTSL